MSKEKAKTTAVNLDGSVRTLQIILLGALWQVQSVTEIANTSDFKKAKRGQWGQYTASFLDSV